MEGGVVDAVINVENNTLIPIDVKIAALEQASMSLTKLAGTEV